MSEDKKVSSVCKLLVGKSLAEDKIRYPVRALI